MSNVQSQVLASISVGAMLTFANGNGSLITPHVVNGQPVLGLGGGNNATFTVASYEYNGSNQAKISLEQVGNFWFPGSNPVLGMAFPLILSEQSADFLLTDTGQGITIQTTFSPPAPFVQQMGVSGTAYLAYGFDTPLLNLFNISVVG